jgi:hypothetical protein
LEVLDPDRGHERLMIAIERRLYRGTTVDWPGNECLRTERLTPTTTDPLVAAIFAIECVRHGPAAIYVAQKSVVAEFLLPGNVLGELECELVVGMPPLEFISRMAFGMFPAQTARQVLAGMSFSLPATISNRRIISDALKEFPRLTGEQIAEFDRRCPLTRIDHATND